MTSKKKMMIIILAVIIFIVLLSAGSAFLQNKYTEDAYNNALHLIDNDSYKAAKTELEKIAEYDYKDTDDLIKLCEAHISYEGGSSGAYMLIDDLKFEYQTKERLDKINAFIEKSRAEYKEFFDKLVEESKAQHSDSSASSQPSYSSSSSSTYKSKSYSYKSRSNDDDYDEYNVKDYKFAEDFYDDHYEDFFDFEDAEDYFNAHND
ncbi:MAG: hypothetical protein KBS52_02080 [Clostridiales bacterium]|nr:hypothetical protein [Candidatus Equinaster intestinalis]